MKTKEGILTNCRITNPIIINESFQTFECLLEKGSINEQDFYEDFVPFLKNLITLVEYFEEHTKLIRRAQSILESIINKCLWIDTNLINGIIGEIKVFYSSSSDDANRRKNSLVGAIRSYLKSLVGKTGVANKIHSFMNDYNRIVYSPAFRRLQDKTQVFPLEQHDYARTRLTHSIEVSSIAAQLGNITSIKLFASNNNNKKDIAFQTEKILSCAALLHDIGNPPFGHFGEDSIKRYFEINFDNLELIDYSKIEASKELPEILAPIKISDWASNPIYEQVKSDFTLFDGNAQSFRIAVKTQMYKPNHSLELTASVLGAMIKYPFASNFEREKWGKAKFGFFYSEQEEFEILEKMKVAETNVRNPLVLLLEAADDICYVTSDLDDAIKKNILTYEIFNREITLLRENETIINDEAISLFVDNFEKFYKENEDIAGTTTFGLTMQRMLNDLRIQLIGEASEAFIIQKENILNGINVVNTDDTICSLSPNGKKNKNCYELLECVKSANLVKWLKGLFPKYIYCSRNIIENELKGFEVISYLLAEFVDAILKLEFDKGVITKRSRVKFAKQNRIFQLISPNFVRTFQKEVEHIDKKDILMHVYYRLKLIVDYISGMTDSYAKEVYETLRGIN